MEKYPEVDFIMSYAQQTWFVTRIEHYRGKGLSHCKAFKKALKELKKATPF